MRHIASATLASALLALAGCGGGGSAAPLPLPPPPEVDLTGTWSGAVSSTASGTATVTLVLAQSGASIAGTYSSSAVTTGSVTGTVSARTASVQISSTTSGCPGTLSATAVHRVLTGGAERLAFSYSGSTACGGAESGAGELARGACAAPALNVYWRPSPSPPQAGFQVPGLAAAGFPAQLDCAQAGVTGVQVFVGPPLTVVPCAGGSALCVDANTWRCDLLGGGITIPLQSGGTYDVAVEGRDPFDNLKYRGQLAAGVPSCADVSVGAFPQGVAGTLELDYVFVPAATCAAGSNIEWTLRRGAVLADEGATPCGGPNPFALAGAAALPAGVYALERVAEVVPGAPAQSFHALCNLAPFVHAGPEVLPVDLPVPTPPCF